MTTETAPMTAAELHAIYNGPWCPTCGLAARRDLEPDEHGRVGNACSCGVSFTKPGLWARAPQTRPLTLRLDEDQRWWLSDAAGVPLNETAALLCLGAAVAAAAEHENILYGLWWNWDSNKYPTIHHAVVSAWHHWLDQQT